MKRTFIFLSIWNIIELISTLYVTENRINHQHFGTFRISVGGSVWNGRTQNYCCREKNHSVPFSTFRHLRHFDNVVKSKTKNFWFYPSQPVIVKLLLIMLHVFSMWISGKHRCLNTFKHKHLFCVKSAKKCIFKIRDKEFDGYIFGFRYNFF